MNRKRSFSTKFGGVALTNLIALVLVYAFFGNSLLEARAGIPARGGSSPAETARKSTLQQRILEVPLGAMMEVRFMDKHKIRGKLGEVTSEGFSLQTAQGTSIETQKIAFTEVKSFKQIEGNTGKKVGTGVLIGLAAFGAFAVIMIAVCASGACGG